jgi:hypothetical protein
MAEEYSKEKVVQWFAGFYEGEGYVSNDIHNMNRLRLGIAQNDPKPLEIGKSIWGGTIKKRVRKSPASDKICTGYEWVLYHNSSLIFINDIKPFMIIPYKKQQLEKCLEVLKQPWNRKFKCSNCEKEYANPSSRRRHVRTVHELSNASEASALQENQIAGNS